MEIKNCILLIKTMLVIIMITLLVLELFWLFKIKNFSNIEPTNRDKYIKENALDIYTKDDFCYEHYNTFIKNGTFMDFNINMLLMKYYSNKIINYYFTFIILGFILYIINCFKKNMGGANNCCSIISFLVALINFIYCILILIYFILLSKNYYKSNIDDFERFSKCKYLNKTFNIDYNFVFIVKRNFKKYFYITIFQFFFYYIISLINEIFKEIEGQIH